LLFVVVVQLSDLEKGALGPYTYHGNVITFALDAQIDKIIKYGTCNFRFEVPIDNNIGGRLARFPIDFYPNRVVRVDRHENVQIGAQNDLLVVARIAAFHGNRRKRRVFDPDRASFGWCYQPVAAVVVTPKDAGEQLDQRESADRRTVVVPVAGTIDSHVDVLKYAQSGRRHLGVTGNTPFPGVPR